MKKIWLFLVFPIYAWAVDNQLTDYVPHYKNNPALTRMYNDVMGEIYTGYNDSLVIIAPYGGLNEPVVNDMIIKQEGDNVIITQFGASKNEKESLQYIQNSLNSTSINNEQVSILDKFKDWFWYGKSGLFVRFAKQVRSKSMADYCIDQEKTEKYLRAGFGVMAFGFKDQEYPVTTLLKTKNPIKNTVLLNRFDELEELQAQFIMTVAHMACDESILNFPEDKQPQQLSLLDTAKNLLINHYNNLKRHENYSTDSRPMMTIINTKVFCEFLRNN